MRISRWIPMCALGLALTGAVVAIGVVRSSGGFNGPPPSVPEGAVPGSPPDAGAPQPAVPLGDGASLRLSPSAATHIAKVPVLSDAPWLFQSGDTPRYATLRSRSSLVFPPGVAYDQALTQLYLSVVTKGDLPDGTRLAPPLPPGKVLRRTADRSQGIAIDLNAPWGYEATLGFLNAPSFALPGSLSPVEMAARVQDARNRGLPLPIGATVDVPNLLPCQIDTGDAATASATC